MPSFLAAAKPVTPDNARRRASILIPQQDLFHKENLRLPTRNPAGSHLYPPAFQPAYRTNLRRRAHC
jgi:hypothetical protein